MLKDFNKEKPSYGELIIIQHPPEQTRFPVVELYDKNTDWFDGSLWLSWDAILLSHNSDYNAIETSHIHKRCRTFDKQENKMKKLTNLQKAKLGILKWDISNAVNICANIFEGFSYIKRSDNSRCKKF